MASRHGFSHSGCSSISSDQVSKFDPSPLLASFTCQCHSLIFHSGANTILVRKVQIGDKWINFIQAAANVASASDGSFVDNSRLMSLRCCNNLLTLSGLHFQVATDAQSFLNAFKSSSSSSVEGIRNEWALFVRNVSAILFQSRSSAAEAHVLACANVAIDIIRSAPPTAGMAVWNAVLALGTCALFSPDIKSQLGGGAKVCQFYNTISVIINGLKLTSGGAYPRYRHFCCFGLGQHCGHRGIGAVQVMIASSYWNSLQRHSAATST